VPSVAASLDLIEGAMARKLGKSAVSRISPAARKGLRDKRKAFVRHYRDALSKAGETAAGRDDLPAISIPEPAVRPKDFEPEQIREAVREALRAFSRRHSKDFASS
jgi:hypothetical protein